MTPYYEKARIVIYRGNAGDVMPELPKASFWTIVFDPPFTPNLDRAMAMLRWVRTGGSVLVLHAKSYSLFPQSESMLTELPEIAPAEELGHPVARPLNAMRSLLAMTKGPILDPYMGIGTTLVAAKHLGRDAVGIELEEKYCRTAVSRLEAA